MYFENFCKFCVINQVISPTECTPKGYDTLQSCVSFCRLLFPGVAIKWLDHPEFSDPNMSIFLMKIHQAFWWTQNIQTPQTYRRKLDFMAQNSFRYMFLNFSLEDQQKPRRYSQLLLKPNVFLTKNEVFSCCLRGKQLDRDMIQQSQAAQKVGDYLLPMGFSSDSGLLRHCPDSVHFNKNSQNISYTSLAHGSRELRYQDKMQARDVVTCL